MYVVALFFMGRCVYIYICNTLIFIPQWVCIPIHIYIILPILVGGFNPFEKYEWKWKSSPSRDEHEKYLKPPPSIYIWYLHITYIQKTSQIITLLQKVLPNGLCPKRESKKPPVTRNAATPGNSDGVRVRKRIELRKKKRPDFPWNTVDGSEILHQLRLVVYHIICRVLYIPGGAGFLPSTVLVGSYRFL